MYRYRLCAISSSTFATNAVTGVFIGTTADNGGDIVVVVGVAAIIGGVIVDDVVDLLSTIGGNNCRRRAMKCGFFRTIKWHCSPRCVRCC